MAKKQKKTSPKTPVSQKKTSPKKSKSKSVFLNRDIWFLLGIAIVYVLIYPQIFDKKIDLNGDNAHYYLYGKGILEGHGYALASDPAHAPGRHYPPGYAAIVAAGMLLSKSITWIKAINGLFFLGSLLLFYLIIKRVANHILVTILTFLFLLVNYHLLYYSTIMMSEIPFMFFSLLAIYLLEKQKLEGHFWKDPKFWGLVACLAACLYIRTLGIGLIIAAMVYFAFQRKWLRAIGVFGGVLLLQLPWIIRNRMLGGGSSYVQSLFFKNPYRREEGMMDIGDFFTRIGNNLSRYISMEIPEAVMPHLHMIYTGDDKLSTRFWLLGICIIAFIVLGLIKTKTYRILILSYFISYFGVLMIWPDVWFGVRFILPLIPFLLFYFFQGCSFLIKMINQSRFKWAQYALLLFVLVLPKYFSGTAKHGEDDVLRNTIGMLTTNSKRPYNENFKHYFDMATYCKEKLPKNAVVGCRKPALFAIFSGGYTSRFPDEKNADKFYQMSEAKGINYFILDRLGYSATGRYLYPAIQANLDYFPVVHQIGKPQTVLLGYQR